MSETQAAGATGTVAAETETYARLQKVVERLTPTLAADDLADLNAVLADLKGTQQAGDQVSGTDASEPVGVGGSSSTAPSPTPVAPAAATTKGA